MGLENLQIEFTEREITAWGGIFPLKRMIDKMAFEAHPNSMALPIQKSNRGYRSWSNKSGQSELHKFSYNDFKRRKNGLPEV